MSAPPEEGAWLEAADGTRYPIRGSYSLGRTANGTERIMCLADEATFFPRTFDIPRALDQINDGTGSWRSISTRSKTHSFVVHRRQTTYESRTLRIGDNVAEILDLLTTPRPKRWILGKFPAADGPATSRAIDDLLRRGVLRECE